MLTARPLRLAGITACGPVPPDEAWERYARPARWPGWSPQIRSVEASAPRIAPGVTGTVHPIVGPGLHFTVDAVDEAARTWSWTVHAGPLHVRLDHDVVPDGGGSRTGLTIHAPLPVALSYAPLAALALRRLVH